MTDHEAWVGEQPVEPLAGWSLDLLDRDSGSARLVGPGSSILVVIEGEGSEWVVTLRGRRIPVTVRSWRERLLAEAEGATRVDAAPVLVKATLPGLVVAVRVAAGDEVGEGDTLMTIEAMKMQNEVRAPRPGRILEVAVDAGQSVAMGAALLRLG